MELTFLMVFGVSVSIIFLLSGFPFETVFLYVALADQELTLYTKQAGLELGDLPASASLVQRLIPPCPVSFTFFFFWLTYISQWGCSSFGGELAFLAWKSLDCISSTINSACCQGL